MKTSEAGERSDRAARTPHGQNSQEAAESLLRPGDLELTRRAVEFCAFPAEARIADFGCGPGASVKLLREAGFHALGMDISPPARADFPCVAGRLEALPLARESLDGIICECVLSLLPEPRPVVRSFGEVLRPGGRLILTDVHTKKAGRLSRETTEEHLKAAGLRLLRFEDHSRCLKTFAARLLWHGEHLHEYAYPARLRNIVSAHACGYGLWIAEKPAHSK